MNRKERGGLEGVNLIIKRSDVNLIIKRSESIDAPASSPYSHQRRGKLYIYCEESGRYANRRKSWLALAGRFQ